jgi:hypothetical protein
LSTGGTIGADARAVQGRKKRKFAGHSTTCCGNVNQ